MQANTDQYDHHQGETDRLEQHAPELRRGQLRQCLEGCFEHPILRTNAGQVGIESSSGKGEGQAATCGIEAAVCGSVGASAISFSSVTGRSAQHMAR